MQSFCVKKKNIRSDSVVRQLTPAQYAADALEFDQLKSNLVSRGGRLDKAG